MTRILFLLIFLVPMDFNFSQDFQISKAGYASFGPEISTNSKEKIVVVWTDYRNSYENNGIDSGSAIYGQFLDNDGDPIGDNFRISEVSLGGGSRIPSVSMNSKGNFVVVWHKSNDIWKDTDIYGRRFRKDGSPNGSSFQINDDNSHKSQLDAKVIMREDESFIVTWLDRRDDSLFSYAQIYSGSGDRIGNNFKVNKNNEEGVAYIGLFINGSFFLSWNRYLQIYDSSNIATSNIIDIGIEGKYFAKGKDSILVIWNMVPSYKIWGRFFDKEGNSISEMFRIDNNDILSNPKSSWDASFSLNGNFIVVWQDHRNDLPGVVGAGDIYAQRFNSIEELIGENFKVNHEPQEFIQRSPSVLFNGDNYITIWEETHPICTPPGTFSLSPSYIMGTIQKFDDPVHGKVFGWKTLENKCDDKTTESTTLNIYPNPVNKRGNISLNLYEEGYVRISIYNILGQKIRDIFNNFMSKGKSIIGFDTTFLSNGVYILLLKSKTVFSSFKIVVLN